MLRLLPLLCLACAAPQGPGYTEFFTDFPQARSLLSGTGTGFTLWQTASGLMAKDAAGTPVLTVDGAAEFTQSFFTGANSKYNIWVRGDNLEGTNIEAGLATDCMATPTGYVRLAKVVAPIFMLNGFYIKGTSYTFNVDGTNSRTDLNTQFVVIKDGTGTVIGCTTALLA